MLALAAGMVGLGLSHVLLEVLLQRLPQDLSWANRLGLNSRVLAFGILLSVASGILFGLAPALQARRFDLARALAGGTRTLEQGLTRRLFVVAQVVLAVLLLTSGILFTRSFSYLNRLEMGFDPEGLLTMRIDLPESQYPPGPQRRQIYRQILERVRALPGVEGAGFTAGLPFTLDGGALGFTLEDREPPPGAPTFAVCRGVSEGYFEALGVGLVAGRFFRQSDMGSAQDATVVINQSLARRYFGEDDPVGRRLKLFGRSAGTPWARIIGVVEDVRRFSLQTVAPPAFYFPYGQIPILHFDPRDLVIRAAGASSSRSSPASPASRSESMELSSTKRGVVFPRSGFEWLSERAGSGCWR